MIVAVAILSSLMYSSGAVFLFVAMCYQADRDRKKGEYVPPLWSLSCFAVLWPIVVQVVLFSIMLDMRKTSDGE